MNYIIEFQVPIAILISTIGLFISLLSVYIAFLAFKRDRAEVKIKITNGFLVYGERIDKLQIFLEAINSGRRPVTLVAAGFELANKKQLAIIKPQPNILPSVLEEGKSLQLYVDKHEIMVDVKKMKTSINSGWFRDATGKVYKARYPFD